MKAFHLIVYYHFYMIFQEEIALLFYQPGKHWGMYRNKWKVNSLAQGAPVWWFLSYSLSYLTYLNLSTQEAGFYERKTDWKLLY